MMSDVATMSQIAHLLGVSVNQVYMWHQRRNRNGFPEPVASCLGRSCGAAGRRYSPMWRINEVAQWYADYDPKAHSGPPPGNRNGFKHGRYAGRKAQQRARREQYQTFFGEVG